MTTILVTLVVIIVIAWCVRTYNMLEHARLHTVSLSDKMARGYQRRSILVSEFAQLIKPHLAQNDGQILDEVEKAFGDKVHPVIRRAGADASTGDLDIHSLEVQTRVLERLIIVARRYPALQTDTGYTYAYHKMTDSNSLATSLRRSFNESTRAYNKMLFTFPNILVTKTCGFTEGTLCELEEDERYPLAIEVL